ncbi:MAG: CcmD family protein [Bacteroidota bacterium]|jgi:CcmD family protein
MIHLLETQIANSEGFMVQDGKIFLVMTIVSIILIGLFVYVASIDKKISQLEKK